MDEIIIILINRNRGIGIMKLNIIGSNEEKISDIIWQNMVKILLGL